MTSTSAGSGKPKKDIKNEMCIAKSQNDKLALIYAEYLQAVYLERESKLLGKQDEERMSEDLANLTELSMNLMEEFQSTNLELLALQNEKLLRDKVSMQRELLGNVDNWLRAARMRKELADALDGRRHLLQTKGISALSEQQHRELVDVLEQLTHSETIAVGEQYFDKRKDITDFETTVEEEISLFEECKVLLQEVENLSVSKIAIQIQLLLSHKSEKAL